jgi:hypothetical protein
MSPPPGRPKEGSLPLGGKARSAKGTPMSAIGEAKDARASGAKPRTRARAGQSQGPKGAPASAGGARRADGSCISAGRGGRSEGRVREHVAAADMPTHESPRRHAEAAGRRAIARGRRSGARRIAEGAEAAA